jgi:Asp-tRNA(Asn)/Glu-tRNA(Gln) amidotransferase B subunit
MSPEDKILAAEQARQLMNNPHLRAAFEAVEAQAISDALAVKWWLPGADRRRRVAIERANVVKQVRAQLESTISGGKIAAKPRPGVA